MATRVTIRVNKDRLDRLIAQLPVNATSAVDDIARDIQERASQIAPRDTGALSASIYVNNGTDSDYVTHAGTAASLNPDAVIVDEVNPDFVLSLFGGGDNAYTSVVGVAVNYGIFQEFGTRFMPPQPYLIPSVEPARDAFIERMSHVADI
jgi:HK97 gp10 family phage protein